MPTVLTHDQLQRDLALRDLTAGPVAEAHVATEAPAGTRRRWRRLTTAWH